VEVFCGRLETLATRPVSVISARAFAPLEKLLGLAERFSTPETVWVLPKGRNAKSELDAARASWQGEFRLEPSRTDADAWIIVATGVRRTAEGKRAR
jgi:16S rRNA (guanine527-N7)-methyltransferase